MRRSFIGRAPSRPARVAPNPLKANASGACKSGRVAPIPPGRPWRYPGTAASENKRGSSHAWPCGPPRCGGPSPSGPRDPPPLVSQAIARTTPVLLALFSLVTVLAWQLSPGGQLSAPMTAWSRHSEPTFANGRVLVRWHFWRARYVVNSTPEVESMQFPPEVFELLFNGLPLAA